MKRELRRRIFLLLVISLAASAPAWAQLPARAGTSGNIPIPRRSAAAGFLSRRGLAGRAAASQLIEARAQHAAMLPLPADSSSPLGQQWLPAGPGQVVTPAYGLVTGRVSSIAADPADTTGNTVYVGTTGGGVWKSTNAAGSAGGASFVPLTDDLPAFTGGALASLSIGALSVQPGGTGVVLAGTGDPNDSLDSYYGSGLLRSTDGGLTWSLIENSDDAATSGLGNFYFVGEAFAGFAWSTTSPNLVVAAVSQSAEGALVDAPGYYASSVASASAQGLYYSTDAGKTWRLATITDGPNRVVQTASVIFAGDGNAATAVVWNPVRQRFYAAVRHHGYYESPDGTTFTRLINQPGAGLTATECPANPGQFASTACPIFRGALAVQPSTGDMFALTTNTNPNGADQGLWQDVCARSGSVCASPTVTFGAQLPASALEDGNGKIPQGDYNLWLAAVPAPGDTLLFAGTGDVFRCSVGAGCVWRNTTNTETCAAAQVAPFQHAVDAAFAASLSLMYFGNDSGLWRTADNVDQTQPACGSDDAAHFQNLNGGLGSLAEVSGLAQDPANDSLLLAGLGVNGTAASTGGSAQPAWPQVLGGYGSTVAIDPANPQNWYANSAGGVSIARCTLGAACGPSDFGAVPAIGGAQVGQDAYTWPLPATYSLDPHDPSQIVVGTCRVWRGPADGSNWSAANLLSNMLDGDQGPFCNGNAVIGSLAVAAANRSGSVERIYAGMADEFNGGGVVGGHVYTKMVSDSNAGATAWTDLASSPLTNSRSAFNPQAFGIAGLAADAHDPTGQTIYATIEGFSTLHAPTALVYASQDAGAHWTNITSNLPDAPANSILVDPEDANTVYIALDTGVYVTTSVTNCAARNCWSLYGVGLPNAPVTQLLTFNSGGKSLLRAATYGRGVWQVPLVTAQVTETAAALSPASLVFAGQPLQSLSPEQSITVTNTGPVALSVTQVASSGDFAQTDNCGSPLAPHASCVVQVTFTPTATGARSGLLTVYGNVPGGQVSASLAGTGVPGAAIVLLPTSMNFGSDLIGTTTTPAQNITISNTGGVVIGLRAPIVSDSEFHISANTCSTSLPPNTGCTVAITFTPSASGPRTGTFSITDDVGTQVAALSGTGLSAATDTIAPASLAFAAQVVGTAGASQQVTLTNSGDSPLASIAVQTTGDFTAVNGCGNSLIGHASCTVTVAYVPKQVGTETGTLTINDVYGRPQTVALSGTGLAPAGISALPTAVDFGSWGVGGSSTAQAVTLTDNGGVPLTGLTYAVAGEFAISGNSCTATVAAGAACVVQVSFSPTQPGPRWGTLTIGSSSLAAPFTIALSGSGEDFQLQATGSSSATITSGQTASYLMQASPATGSNGTLAVTCTGAPANSVCTVNPASVQIASGITTSFQVSVATGVSSTASSLRRQDPWEAWRMVLFALLLPFGLTLCRRRSATLLALLILVLLPLGCGVSASGGAAPPPVTPPTGTPITTPSGTYPLVITATGPGIARSAKLTLIVE